MQHGLPWTWLFRQVQALLGTCSTAKSPPAAAHIVSHARRLAPAVRRNVRNCELQLRADCTHLPRLKLSGPHPALPSISDNLCNNNKEAVAIACEDKTSIVGIMTFLLLA